MKISIPETGDVLAQLPQGWLALNVFQRTPMQQDFIVLGRHLDKTDQYGMFYFDGISNIPISYETFWHNEEMLRKLGRPVNNSLEE